MDSDVLVAILSHHGGNLEAAVISMLDVSDDAPRDEFDALEAQVSRRAQEELDAEVAKVLDKELREEEARTRQHDPAAVAARTLERELASAKQQLERTHASAKKLWQKVLHATKERREAPSHTHSTRLRLAHRGHRDASAASGLALLR